jgi:hypothetical protein
LPGHAYSISDFRSVDELSRRTVRHRLWELVTHPGNEEPRSRDGIRSRDGGTDGNQGIVEPLDAGHVSS